MRALSVIALFLIIYSTTGHSKMLVRKNYDIDSSYDLRDQKSWTSLGRTHEQSFKILFDILDRSASAREIVARAKRKASEQGLRLIDILQVGDVSVCDMTLVRRFSPTDPSKITYESVSKVYLNRHLKVLDGALDLVHELTHYSMRDVFNPYQENFTLPEFMASTIEGRGGEVDAYMVECQVLSELAPRLERNHSVCQKIRDPSTAKLSRFHAAKEFYKVGDDYKQFWKVAKRHKFDKGEVFPVTDDDATFVSSVSNTSYPLAALLDYEKIVKRSCDNDLRRIASFNSGTGRFPASDSSSVKKVLEELERSYKQRCQKFN